MTLGAGGPRSYHGARFPGIPGLSGLSPQSHGALKVDRQNIRQHAADSTRVWRPRAQRGLAGGDQARDFPAAWRRGWMCRTVML